MLGIAPCEFEDMTLAEFDAAEQGFIRCREQDYRTAMEVQRWGSYVVLSGLVDLKGRGPEEVLPLPWDRRIKKIAPKISKREMERMQKEALETAMQFEAWAKR